MSGGKPFANPKAAGNPKGRTRRRPAPRSTGSPRRAVLHGGLALLTLAAPFGMYALLDAALPDPRVAQPPRWVIGEAREQPKTPPDDPELVCDAAPPWVIPDGQPPSLACDEARRIVSQARRMLAAEVPPVDASSFAMSTAEWIDPHGMWSAAPDAPTKGVLAEAGPALLAELEAPPGSGPCVVATRLGERLASWSGQLRVTMERAAMTAEPAFGDPYTAASEPPFEDGEVTTAGLALANKLGRRIGRLERTLLAEEAASLRHHALARYAPDLTPEGWAEVALAAAVRAYVPHLDAHGAWAPLEEEVTIYDLALDPDPPPQLWGQVTRTTVGIRIDADPIPPLQVGDVVLEARGLPLAGISMEQASQLALLPDVPEPAPVTVLRAGDVAPRKLSVLPHAEPAVTTDEPVEPMLDALPITRIPYGDGFVSVVAIPDVPDDLGVLLIDAIAVERNSAGMRGLVLDLRRNGGGSTDGAIAGLSLFLPGAAMFPMRRRDGAIEFDRTHVPPPRYRYDGPLSVFVDGDSASAAEMIAGAISTYKRGTVFGTTTFGKGCAQEYVEDETSAGVLRLTTLLFALPDGSPLQGVGIKPDLALPLAPATEREADIVGSLAPWRGPDIRDPWPQAGPLFPDHAGRVGPCDDAVLCQALRTLGTRAAAAR